MKTQSISSEHRQFDSNNGNNGERVPIPNDKKWHRVITVAIGSEKEIRADIFVSGGPVRLRVTRAASPGEDHVQFTDDLSKTDAYIVAARTGGPGTVNQPEPGAIVGLNICPHIGAEVGFEAMAVSGAPTVRVHGGI